MTCRELVERLAAYLDREVDRNLLAACEDHLAECDSCRAYLDSYRKTVEQEKGAFTEPEEELPEDLAEVLRATRPRD